MISMKEAYWAERRRAEKAEAEVSLHRGYAEEARKLYLLAEAELVAVQSTLHGYPGALFKVYQEMKAELALVQSCYDGNLKDLEWAKELFAWLEAELAKLRSISHIDAALKIEGENVRLREALKKIDRCISNNRLLALGARLFVCMLQDFAREALAGGSE